MLFPKKFLQYHAPDFPLQSLLRHGDAGFSGYLLFQLGKANGTLPGEGEAGDFGFHKILFCWGL